MSDCCVCTEKFNKRNRMEVKCPKCGLSACRECYEKHILAKTTPICIGYKCGHTFSRRFLREHFTQDFVNKKHAEARKEALFSIEKSKLPESMEAAKSVRDHKMYRQKHAECVEKYNAEKSRLLGQIDSYVSIHTTSPERVSSRSLMLATNEESAEYYSKVRDIELQLAPLLYDVHFYSRMIDKSGSIMRLALGQESRDDKRHKRDENRVVTSCPIPECRGYVTAKMWRCGVCDCKVCARCHKKREMAEDDENREGYTGPRHVCDENEVATVNMLKAQTKPCPKCAIPIMKVFGCDQMWATCCNISFDYRTGDVIEDRSYFHNPEYVEYLSRKGITRDQDVNRGTGTAVRQEEFCGMPPLDAFISKLRNYGHSHFNPMFTSYIELWRMIIDRNDFNIGGRGAQYANPNENENNDLRIQYLADELIEEEFKSLLLKRIDLGEKFRSLRSVQEVFRMGTAEIFGRVIQNPVSWDSLRELKTFEDLVAYVCEEYKITCKVHNTRIKFIDNDTFTELLVKTMGEIQDRLNGSSSASTSTTTQVPQQSRKMLGKGKGRGMPAARRRSTLDESSDVPIRHISSSDDSS